MFDKMKELFEMQKKMKEVKDHLDKTFFDVQSGDGSLKITMNASQQIKDVLLLREPSVLRKENLEAAIKDAVNKGIKRSHDLAAEKMKQVSGLNIPGL